MNVYYNDNEAYPCKVIRARIKDGMLPSGLVDERDICDVTAQDIAPYAHVHLFAGIGVFALGFNRAGVPLDCRILTGGFPCQDLSVAGKQAGFSGERSGLWSQMVRLIQESSNLGKPFDFIVIENVRNLLSGGDHEDAIRATDSGSLDEVTADAVWRSWMGTVLADLAEAGYDGEWACLSASDYGAPHRRERVFIVAYPNGVKCVWGRNTWTRRDELLANVGTGLAHTLNTRCETARHISDRQIPRWKESGREQSASGARRSGESGELADATKQGLPLRGQAGFTTSETQTETGMDAQPERYGAVEYPDSQRQGGVYAQCSFCRIFDGTPHRLHGYRWPAQPGQQQHEWEPPRVVAGKVPNRNARLKALGNALMLPIVEDIGYSIKRAWLARLEVSA